MFKMVKSSEKIEEFDFQIGADMLLTILKSIRELEGYSIDVIELDNGGVEVHIGTSVYCIERNF